MVSPVKRLPSPVTTKVQEPDPNTVAFGSTTGAAAPPVRIDPFARQRSQLGDLTQNSKDFEATQAGRIAPTLNIGYTDPEKQSQRLATSAPISASFRSAGADLRNRAAITGSSTAVAPALTRMAQERGMTLAPALAGLEGNFANARRSDEQANANMGLQFERDKSSNILAAQGLRAGLANQEGAAASQESSQAFQGGENALNRALTSSESTKAQNFQGGENALNRTFEGGQNDLNRQLTSSESTKAQTFQGGQNDLNRTFEGGQNDLNRNLTSTENQKARELQLLQLQLQNSQFNMANKPPSALQGALTGGLGALGSILGAGGAAGKAGATGGILGGLGGAIGSWGGGSVVTPGVGGAAGSVASTGTGLLGAAHSAYAATIGALPVAGQIALGVAGAILLGKKVFGIGNTHKSASEWVGSEQNMFDKSMSEIDKNASATPDMKTAAKAELVKQYFEAAKNFKAQGKDQKTVIDQAMQTFKQYYGDPSQYGAQLP